MNHPLVQHILSLGHLVVVLLVSHLGAIFYQTDFQGIAVLGHITLILLNKAPKHKTSHVRNSDVLLLYKFIS